MLTSEEFSDLFLNDKDKQNRFLFTEGEAIGFSILKEYPQDGLLFKPIKNQKGELDTVALIKIYFVPRDTNKSGYCPLYIGINASSKYLLQGRMRYNYEDLDSPSAEALEVWHKSLKPAELIEINYIFDVKNNKVIKKTSNETVIPYSVIENIFNEHIKTVKPFRGLPFRIKTNSRDFLGNNLLYICTFILWFCKKVFSRDINKDTQRSDTIAYELNLKPVPHKLFILKQQRELKIFGTEIPVSKHSVITTPFIFLTLYATGIVWFPSLKYTLDRLTNDNTFVATALVIAWFVIFDNWLPHILLFISNSIVRIANRIRNMRVKV